MPLYDAGRSTEPTVCDPMATGHIRAATDTAEPLLEPPGVWAGFQGFLALDGSMQANSVVTVLPSMMAPAFWSRSMVTAVSFGT